MSFQSAPLLRMIDRYVPFNSGQHRKFVERATDAILPLLSELGTSDFAFSSLGAEDLEGLRAALEEWLGCSLGEVRAITPEELHACSSAIETEDDPEGDEEEASCYFKYLGPHLHAHCSHQNVFSPFVAMRVSESMREDMGVALETMLRSLSDAQDSDHEPTRILALALEVNLNILIMGLYAALMNDARVYRRVEPLFPWLARCAPICGLIKDAPGVWIVLASGPIGPAQD